MHFYIFIKIRSCCIFFNLCLWILPTCEYSYSFFLFFLCTSYKQSIMNWPVNDQKSLRIVCVWSNSVKSNQHQPWTVLCHLKSVCWFIFVLSLIFLHFALDDNILNLFGLLTYFPTKTKQRPTFNLVFCPGFSIISLCFYKNLHFNF